MSNDTVMTVTVKGIGDFSDVVSNVGSVQKALTKLKLPDKLGDSLSKNITSFYKEYEKYQKKISEGIKTQGDYNQVEKSLNNMRNLYQAIGKDAQKLTQLDMKDMLNLDTGELKKIMDEMTSVMKQIGSVKIDTSPFTKAFKDIQGITKNSKIVGEDGLLNKIIGSINTGQITEAKKQLQELQNYAKKVAPRTITTTDDKGNIITKQAPGTLSAEKYQQLTSAINSMNSAVSQAETAINPLIEKHNNLQKELDETKQKTEQNIKNKFKGYNEASGEVEKLTDSLKRMHQEEFSFNREAQNIDRQIQSYFGLSQMIRKVGDIARDAFATVKDLDKAMTETAVVTNFSVGDMWDMLPTYTAQANQLGSTIRDVYEAATLYYQQGLNTNQAMGLANETLKMARIAGLDAKDATDMMTAALRGFNMEVNQMSAQKINDIYSELAAITASDTKEIGSAMERTASIANSANMEFATTSAFLAQMIETTREAPENLGTAMKTIVARFQEMKQDPTKLVDSEGVAMDVNKVDKALKTIGVSLTNTKGEFRDLDDVFLDISAKWDSLSQGQQRYIATIAAGSRQQSRFIAMMSNYERTMELVDAANNSAGASQRQFEKTLDSMEAKLNKLKNAWDQFTMGLMNNQIIKTSVDLLTGAFTIVNKLIDTLGSIPTKPFEGITKSALTLITTLGMLQLGKRGSRGLVQGIFGWWKEGKSFTKSFSEGWAGPEGTKAIAKQSKYGDVIKADIISAKIPQTIQGEFVKGKALATAAFNTGTKLIAVDNFISSAELSADARAKAEEWWAYYRARIEQGKDTFDDGLSYFNSKMAWEKVPLTANPDEIRQSSQEIQQLGNEFTGLGSRITKAGASLQAFGATMQGTPFEPFGNALIRIGNLLVSAGDLAISAGKKLKTAWKAAQDAKKGGATNAGAIGAFFKSFTKIPAQALIILAIVAAMGALIHHVATQGKRDLEAAENAAAAASEAYDSAKQEASELADAIDKIHEADSAFDGLVVGTAAFNEQLVTANDQIMELIKKYPMLNEYLTTDKNGVMHISEEGLTAVKEYQKQKQANASALNILQTNDLRAEETKQQIEALRKKDKGASEYSADKQQNKDEIELLEKRIKAEDQAAKLSAVNTALVGKEISNREKVSTILADQYDMRKSMVQLEGDKHDKRQQYADFYGYTYNRSTKKMTDVEGNEIEFDDKVIEDALKDITILADFEVDAGAVDTAIASIDKKFSKQFNGDNSFFSDILSDNIETNEDLLRDVLQNPDKLENAVSELSEKEIAAVLGVSADAVAEAPDKYKDELTDKLTDKAKNIAESQADAWGELGAMIAQSEGMTAEAILDGRQTSVDLIQRQLTDFTAQQRDLMVSIGKSLESGAGVESMKTFISGATDIYRSNSQSMIDEFNGLVENVNWDSPIARLKAYGELAKSDTAEIKKMGQELLNSTDSANLLGEAFEEFYNSSDWAELSENMDNFVDASGKLNAAAVEDMAEQCGSLNNLLDTGAISAGGVAAAINALGSDGELTLLDLNSSVLKLLTDFNQLEDAISSAHHSIENFDWGIDTGEAEDFAKESAEKWKELYDNGEYGNPQLEAYAKYILGEENYIKMLNKNHGDLEETMDKVAKYVNRYADGFDSAWERIAGGSWQGEKIQKKLAKAGLDDKGIKMFTEGDHIVWEPGTATTDELIKWLQEVEGVSEEWAKVMLEDWENYSPNFRAERQKNDFEAGLRDGSYIDEHRNANGGVTITASELETIAAATGKDRDYVIDAIKEASDSEVDVIENLDDNLDNYDKLNQDYNKAITGSINKSWIEPLTKVIDGQKQVDASQAIIQAIGDGFKQDQAEKMAYDELSKAVAEGTDVWYKDKLLTPEDLASFDNFKTAIQEFEDNKQWVQVGEAIAEGVVSYLEGKNKPEDKNADSNNSSTPTKTTPKVEKPSQKDNKYTDTGTGSKEKPAPEKAKWENYVPGWLASAIKAVQAEKQARAEQNKTATGPSAEEVRKRNKEFWNSSQTASENTTNAATILTESATNAGNSLQQAATSLEGSATSLNSAAAALTINSPKNNTNPKSGTVPGVPQPAQPNQSSVSGTVTVDGTSALETLTAIYDKATETAAKINEGASFAINVSGDKKLNAAADSANKISNSTGDKSFSVKATASGTDDTNALTNAVKDFNSLSNKTIKLKASTSGLIGTMALTAAAKAFSNLNDHTVTLKTIKITETYPHTGGMVKEGGGLQYRAKGGSIFKKKGTDTVPAMLTPGEYVQNRGAVQYFGVDFMRKINHKDLIGAIQSFGSAAKGRYGTVGPNGKGGLTLTGEEGFEIVWLPSENRSMIVGNGGPQMLDLPSDAVVYTHEESQDILKRQGIDAGSHSRRRRKGGSGGSGGSSNSTGRSGSGSSSTATKAATKAADKVAGVAGKFEVWWQNMARRVDANQKKVDKNQSDLEKTLKKFGTTRESIQGLADTYRKNLQQSIALNKQELDKANKELKFLTNGKNHYFSQKEISYEVSKKDKKGKTSTESKKQKIDLNRFIAYNSSTGAYEIDQAKINKIGTGYKDSKGKWVSGNQSKAQAIAEAAEKEINDRVSKIKTAEDNINKAQEALEKLSNDIYETFDRWEKSINEVYLLSQKLQLISGQLSVTNAKLELQYSKLDVGATNASQALGTITSLLEAQRTDLLNKAQASQADLSAKQTAFQDSLSLQPYLSKYLKNPDSSDARNDYLAAKKALEFLNSAGLDGNNFDYDKALTSLNQSNITKDEYDAIKGVLDGIFDKQNDYLGAQEAAYSSLNEIYQQMSEYQSFIADFEDNLLSGIEAQAKDEIKKLDTLNTSLTKAYKDLLDEVKNKLDERRKREDNQKTESNISKKQQRLAALRADTSGGHQVEIAQLEQEISDMQQDYQRSLEDQLIEKLQQQGDLAEKQRQQQIDLLQAHAEIAEDTGANLAQIKEWLANPDQYYDEIRSAWLSGKGYDTATPQNQENLENEWETTWAKYQGYSKELDQYEKMNGSLDEIETSVDDILDSMSNMPKATYTTAKEALKGEYKGKDVAKAYGGVEALKAGVSGKDAQAGAGWVAATVQKAINDNKDNKEVTQTDMAGVSVKMDVNGKGKGGIVSGTITKSGKYAYANDGSTLYGQAWDSNKGQLTGQLAKTTIDKLDVKHIQATQEAQEALIYAIQHTTPGKVINKKFKALAEAAGIIGKVFQLSNKVWGSVGSTGEIVYNDGKKGVYLWDPATGKQKFEKYNATTFKKKAKYKTVGSEYADVLRANGITKFSTGGLAGYTGPAWLDGTPSKPELVLDATDTKNFLALRDVLSKAVGSVGSVNNSYDGNATYEININVDKIEKDYDVDRVAERVKKIIVKDSGYRNVTQVRNFR